MGQEVTDDKDMLDKIKQWKTKRTGKAKGFSAEPPAEEAPEKEAPPKAAPAPAAAAPAPTAPAPAPAPAAAKAAESERVTVLEQEKDDGPKAIVMPSHRDAIGEFLRRAQKDADPAALSTQQLIAVFFAFFNGFRQRHGIPGPIDLSPTQKQMTVLLFQTSLSSVSASRDFWPRLCAELGNDRDPEVVGLMTALTGVQTVRKR